MVTNEYKDLNYKPIDMNFDNENEEQFFDGMEIILNQNKLEASIKQSSRFQSGALKEP